jgi:uncharacterized membrane protein
MQDLLKKFFAVLILFLIVDLVWLKFFAGPKYVKSIKEIQGGEEMKPNMYMGIVVYLVMTVLLVLCLNKQFTTGELFIVGFCTYAVYDFTNAAIFKKWDKLFGLFDSLWGGILFAVVGMITRKLIK